LREEQLRWARKSKMQQNLDLTPASWTLSGGISNDGVNNFITITSPTGNLFFRL
jgi:hypothetical protein